jgi:hypothetical protein
MKKALVFLAFVLALVACSKPHVEPNQAAVAPAKTTYFSHVNYYKDNRQPATDTVWTMRMMSQAMADSFAKDNGKVYWESSTVKEVGVLWSK